MKINGPDILKLLVAVAVSFLPAVAGAFFRPGDWYAQLAKPPYHPPDWVFGPVWTLLYLLMGVAAWIVWRRGLGARGVAAALGAFAAQLLLNALWTPVFFGAQSIGGGLVVIIPLWVLIVVTLLLFWRISAAAGALLLPYLLWVSFATVLNAHLLVLNR